MTTFKKISKAEEKRIKENTRYVLAHVTSKLAQFKNNNLEANGNWAVKRIELILEDIKDGKNIHRGWTSEKASDFYTNRLKKKTLIAFEAMKEAELNFDAKVANMVDKMIAAGMTHTFLSVEHVSNSGREFSFLVSNRVIEVHARAIWVDGAIKAPHYRFITTSRVIK